MSLFFQYLAVKTLLHISYAFVILYVIINIFYSFGLKNLPLLDLAILVSGFLIRTLYGANIININISNWLYLTVISAAFYLGLGKRRNEIKKSGAKTRKVLTYYTESFLNQNMTMFQTLTIIFYSLWSLDSNNVFKSNNLFIWTVPLVMLILMKYSMDVDKDSHGDPVDVIFKDKILLASIFLYGIIIMGIMYLK